MTKADGPKISGTLIFRIIGLVLIIFFHEVFWGIVLIVFAGRLSNALDLDEKLQRAGSAAKSRPRRAKRTTVAKNRPEAKSTYGAKPKPAPPKDPLMPCPYCGRDIKPSSRKCPVCNHTL